MLINADTLHFIIYRIVNMPPVLPPAVDSMYSPNARLPLAQPNQAEPRIFKVRRGSVETNFSIDSSLRETMEYLLREFDNKELQPVCQ